jgi:hypothetical protein
MTRSGDWNSKAIELTRQTEAAGGNPYREIALRLMKERKVRSVRISPTGQKGPSA